MIWWQVGPRNSRGNICTCICPPNQTSLAARRPEMFFSFFNLFLRIFLWFISLILYFWPQTSPVIHGRNRNRNSNRILTWKNSDLSSWHLSTTCRVHLDRKWRRSIRFNSGSWKQRPHMGGFPFLFSWFSCPWRTIWAADYGFGE